MDASGLKEKLNTAPIDWYVFGGEEEYLKRYYLSEIRKSVLVEESLAGFNHTKVSYLDKSAKKGKTYTYIVKAYSGSSQSANKTGLKIKDKY